MRIPFVASEAAPGARIGGPGDVPGPLPEGLRQPGREVSVVPGRGQERCARFFRGLQRKFPNDVSVKIMYHDALAHEREGSGPGESAAPDHRPVYRIERKKP